MAEVIICAWPCSTTYPASWIQKFPICPKCGGAWTTKEVKSVQTIELCVFVFKDNNCNYTGSDCYCSKTFEDCTAKGNARHFGGIPRRSN